MTPADITELGMSDPGGPKAREGVDDHSIASAEDFLTCLSPRHKLWTDDPTAWIYRCHANAEWELKAKAVRRPEEFAKYGIRVASLRPGHVPGSVPAWSERVGFQERLLKRFRAGLDRAGLVSNIVELLESEPHARSQRSPTISSPEPAPRGRTLLERGA
jgi:hypothetical protein